MTPQAEQSITNVSTSADVLDSTQNAEASSPIATTPEAGPPKTDERISSKLSVLTRRERAAVERERAATAKEQEITAREKRLQEFEALKKTNPLKALELLGLSYQDLTQVALNDGAVTPDIQVKNLEDKFDSFLKSQEDAKARETEESKRQAAEQEEKMTAEFKGKIGSYLKDNASRYELTSFHYGEDDAMDMVYGVIDEHYARTAPKDADGNFTGPGAVMTIAEAADKVELHLEQKYREKATGLNKLKGFLAVRQETPAAKTDTKPQTQTRQTQKTLTNNLSAQSKQPQGRFLTDEERVQKAIAYARGLRS